MYKTEYVECASGGCQWHGDIEVFQAKDYWSFNCPECGHYNLHDRDEEEEYYAANETRLMEEYYARKHGDEY